jgi:GNAT superfamily N-acetyltransferase
VTAGRSPALAVRAIERADEAAWRELWRGYLAFYETTRPEPIYRATFDRLTDAAVTDYAGLIATQDGTPIGLAHYIFHRHGWQIEEVCYLQDLYVDPAARGTGAGRALIEAVYAAADAAGRPSVYWLTQDFNTPARRLYDRIGTVTPFIKYVR